MGFRLKSGEPIPKGLKRIVTEEVESAIGELSKSNDGPERAEAIHEARKSVKKIRSVLRLVEPELGKAFATENKRLQSVGQRLSVFRDGDAIIEVFDSLQRKYDSELPGSLDSVRRGLVARKGQTEQEAGIDDAVRDAVAVLRKTGKRVKSWPLETDGFGAIASGFEKTFGRGSKALAQARKDPRPENYHEWRKRVKDHWYHVRLLEDLWTAVMLGYEKSLKDLETWLGDDHNLIVLRGKLEADPEFYGGAGETGPLLAAIERYQKELRENSLSLGERIYEEKPARFTKRMKHLWQAWRSQPESLKAVQQQEKEAVRAEPQPVQRRSSASEGVRQKKPA